MCVYMQFTKQSNYTRSQKCRIEKEKGDELGLIRIKNVWSWKDISKKTKANQRWLAEMPLPSLVDKGPSSWGVGVNGQIFTYKGMRLREVKYLTQGHKAIRWQSQDSNSAPDSNWQW